MTGSEFFYHRLFSHPLMMEELIRAFVPDAMAARLDFESMERVEAKFHAQSGQRREGDVVWRIRTGEGHEVYLYLLVEFQSESDWWMPVRAQVYQGLLWQQIIAEKRLKAGELLPPVLMIVLYNGGACWTARVSLSELIDLPTLSPLWHW